MALKVIKLMNFDEIWFVEKKMRKISRFTVKYFITLLLLISKL